MNRRNYSPETWIIFFVFCFVVWLGWKFIQRCLRKKYTITVDGTTVVLPQYYTNRECPGRMIEQSASVDKGVVGCRLEVPVKLRIDVNEYRHRGDTTYVTYIFPTAEQATQAALSLNVVGDKTPLDYLDYLGWPGFAYLLGEEPRPTYFKPDYIPNPNDKLENKYRAAYEKQAFRGTFPYCRPVNLPYERKQHYVVLDVQNKDDAIEYIIKVPFRAQRDKWSGPKVEGQIVDVTLKFDDLNEALKAVKFCVTGCDDNWKHTSLVLEYLDHFADPEEASYTCRLYYRSEDAFRLFESAKRERKEQECQTK